MDDLGGLCGDPGVECLRPTSTNGLKDGDPDLPAFEWRPDHQGWVLDPTNKESIQQSS